MSASDALNCARSRKRAASVSEIAVLPDLAGAASISIALVTHYALGVIFGLVMGAVLAQLRLDRTPGQAASAGAIMGLVLYLVNFDLLVAFFPWLAWLRGWDTVAAHAVFGVVAAYLYWRLKRTAAEG